MSLFNRESRELRKNLKAYKAIIEEARKKGKFSFLETENGKDLIEKGIGLDYYNDYIKEYDDMCNIPHDLGVWLYSLAKNRQVMFKRSKFDFDRNSSGLQNSSKKFFEEMKYGIENQGHINAVGGSALMDLPPIGVAMSPLEGLAGYINLVEPYKENDTVIIAAFPKEWFDKNGEVKNLEVYKEMYDFDRAHPTIKPEYLVGAIIKKNNGLDEFYTRDEIIKALEPHFEGTKTK